MENLDLCILHFCCGPHPGHSLRKAAGENDPAGRFPSFCNESQRATNWRVLVGLPSPGEPSPSEDQAAYDLSSRGAWEASCNQDSTARSCLREGKEGGECSCHGKRSERRKFCVVLSIQLPETGPRTPEARESHRAALGSSVPKQVGYEGPGNDSRRCGHTGFQQHKANSKDTPTS